MAGDTYTGQVLDGKYRLTRLLGKGGMGAVYRGEHVIIGKQVAVKFLHAEFANNTEVVKRFYREAQAAAAIGHDGIIDVSDVGTSSLGDPYLVMEYLEGESLADMLTRTGPLDLGAALGIMEPALLALHAAHSKGIVHRDLKPDNIFLVHQQGAPPKIKLIDFGISKFAEAGGGEKLTQTGSVMGTPVYMSPEQARGAADLDHRADLYSMGVMLYEMLTAKLPFDGNNFTEIIINILTAAPRPPLEAFPGFPAEAEAVILRALEKDPARRFATAIEFVEALSGLSEFGQRQSKLTHVASQIKKTTFAAGSLGPKTGSDGAGPVGADVLAQMSARAGTPSGWAGTRPEPHRGRGKTLLVIGLVAGAISIAGAVALVLVLGRADGQPPAAVPLTTPAAEDPGATTPAAAVAITVTGLPAGARVFFNDMLVTVNPFKVRRSEAVTPLRIEADGFEPLVLTVIPSADQAVAVPALQPVARKEEDTGEPRHGKTAKTGKSKKPEPPAAVSGPPPPQPDKAADKKKLEQGARGTKVSTEFE
ncbi:MAG TPA: serine/threonine-protein kinase [Polyangia bacterium]|nr:serine/threonine-protein kinase [Polyangia bacterium]